MEIVLHLGAHRTGSTAVDQALSRNRRLLWENGIGLRLPGDLRAIADFGAVAELAPRAAEAAEAARRLGGVRAAIDRQVRMATRRGRVRLILSEENILGTMQGNLRARALYPDLAPRLAAYAAVLPAPARIGLAIRSYDTVWMSMVRHVSHAGHPVRGRGLAAALAAAPRGWPEVIGELRAAFPAAAILVWRQEALAGNVTAVARRLAGLGDGVAMIPHEAVANASARYAAQDGAAVPRLAFSAAEAERLRARYRADLGRIAAMAGGVTLLDPAEVPT